jgi:hypothetical protein
LFRSQLTYLFLSQALISHPIFLYDFAVFSFLL